MPKNLEASELTLGKYLMELRVNANMDTTRARKVLGLKSFQALYGLEREQWTPPMLLIKRMSKHYGVPDIEIRQAVVDYKIARIKKRYGLT